MSIKYYDGSLAGWKNNDHHDPFDDGGNPYIDGNDEGFPANPPVEIDVIFPKTETLGTSFFASKQHDPLYYLKVEETYRLGGFYHINGEVCKTLRDFNSFLYNFFVRCYWNNREESDLLVWGLNKTMNQNPERTYCSNEIYYDGMIFGVMREEFLYTLLHYTPAHILSFIIHYGSPKFDYIAQYE